MGDTFADIKTEAFACQNFWSGIAMAAVFAYSSHLCFNIQTYILSAVCLCSVAGYLLLYFHLERAVKMEAAAKLNSDVKA